MSASVTFMKSGVGGSIWIMALAVYSGVCRLATKKPQGEADHGRGQDEVAVPPEEVGVVANVQMLTGRGGDVGDARGQTRLSSRS